MIVTGTHMAYYQVCHRKLWLFSNGISMEHTSELVEEGKIIAENTYLDRSRKYTELQLGSIKIDYYDARNRVIHEVKKSNSLEDAHKAQVMYYLYVLVSNGIENPSAILEYPKLKHREVLNWDSSMINTVKKWKQEIEVIVHSNKCPKLLGSKICNKCSYYDFCYINEEE